MAIGEGTFETVDHARNFPAFFSFSQLGKRIEIYITCALSNPQFPSFSNSMSLFRE
jgi:hypothetical protein